jgi:phosphatidate cytidylyltransferase
MKMRILTAVFLLPALLAVLLVGPKRMTVLLCGAFCTLAAYELLKNTGLVKHTRLVFYAMVSAFCVAVWSFYGMDPVWERLGILLFFGLMFMEMMLSHLRLPFEKVCMCAAAGLLNPFLLCSLMRIFSMNFGRYLVLIPFVVAFMSDSGAYFIGCRFGRHKLAPVISPKKSVEGVFGGVVFSVLGMLIYALVIDLAFDYQISYVNAAVYGFIGSLGGVFGDLCFSVIKRQTGIKDYSRLIPGHGGILDRFDSTIFVAPMVEVIIDLWPAMVSIL